jgi:2-oxoglutarate ferredoxin oxidoreductase subunit alpha
VLIPEVNSGQLAMLIRSAHLVDAKTYSKVQGQPIFAEELESEMLRVGWNEKQGDEQ